MSEHDITGKRVAFLLTDGVEQVELTSPWDAVKNAGGEPVLVAPKSGKLQGFEGVEKGDTFDVDLTLKDANAADFHALVIPGGVVNADHLRVDKDAQAFARSFLSSTSRWRLSAMDLGCSLTRASSRAGTSPRTTRWPQTCGTRAPTGATRKSWWTRAS
jgi:hypothetical protein